MVEAKKEWAQRVKEERKALKQQKQEKLEDDYRKNQRVHNEVKKCEKNALK